MKTRYYLFCLLTTIMAFFSLQTASAQTAQDALYIFRNDGKFNAFFYGDIDHIAYSKVDTLGKTQKDYVVQEIYALDSVWRIPVSAIDSVAFVTPKTVYKKDVFRPDKSISKYIIASDTINWIRLSKNTPEKLIPKKGDKLLIEEPSKYIPNGFGGKVTSVTTTSAGNYTVKTTALQLTDVYERLVMKGAVGPNEDDSSAKETRGVTDGTFLDYSDTWDIEPITQTLKIAGSQSLIEGMNGNFSVALAGEGNVNFTLTPKVTARGFLFLDPIEGVKINTFAKIYTGVAVKGDVDGALVTSVDIPFTLATNKKSLVKGFGKKDENDKYPLLFDFSAGVNLNATGHVKSTFNWAGASATIAENITYTKPLSSVTGDLNRNHSLNGEQGTFEYEIGIDKYFQLGIGLYAKGEVKFNNPVVKEDDLQLGIRGDFAFTEDFRIGKSAFSISKDLWKTAEDKPYDALKADPITNGELFLDGQAYAKLFKTSFGPYTKKVSLWEFGFPVVPKFKSFKMTPNEKAPSIVKFSSSVSRNVLMPVRVGFAVFKTADAKEVGLGAWYSKTYRKQEFKSFSSTYTVLDPGVGYVAVPKMKFSGFGNPFVVTDVEPIYFDLGEPMIEVDKTVEVGAEKGSQELTVLTNIPEMVFTSDVSWLTTEWTREEGALKITWTKLPSKTNERKATIHITGKSSDLKKVLMEKDIVVTQCVAYLELSAGSLNFDAKGGSKTVKVTKTNLTNIKVSSKAKYISVKYSKNTITVTVTENKDKDSREDRVIVEGTTPGGQPYQGYFDVTQEGTGKEQTDPSDPGATGDVVALLDSVYVNIRSFKFGTLYYNVSIKNPKKNITVLKEKEGYSVTVVNNTEYQTEKIKFHLSEREDNGYDYPFKEITNLEYEYAYTKPYNTLESGHYFTKVKFKCGKVPVYGSASWPTYYYYEWDGYGDELVVTEGSGEHTYVSHDKEVTSETLNLTSAGSVLMKTYIYK